MAYFRSFIQTGATGISISQNPYVVPYKGTVPFLVTVTPSDSWDVNNYTVTSSNTSVLTVTKMGMLVYAYGVSVGSATITVSLNGHTSSASVSVDYNGSYFVFNNNKYYYDMAVAYKYTNEATVIQRYVYTGLQGSWNGTQSSFDDRTAGFRTVIQSYINANFSTNLKNTIKSHERHVNYTNSSGSSVLSYMYNAKFFLPTEYELYNRSGSSTLPQESEFLNKINKFGEVISGDSTVTKFLSRSVGSDGPYVTNRHAIAILNASPYYSYEDFDATLPLRPYYLVNNTVHVSDIVNPDGTYSIDWNNRSSKTINDLTEGTFIRDDSGTGRTG